MNIKLISVISALAVSAAVAQDYDDEYEEESSATESVQEEAPAAPAPEPAPAAEPEPASTSNSDAFTASDNVPTPVATGKFNVLHGNAYNLVNNQFGASTIDGDMNAVYKMAGRKLFYVEPTGKEGVLALGSANMTYLLAFSNRGTLGIVTAGLATNSFGVAFDLGIDKTWESYEHKADNVKNTRDESTTEAGDYINVKFGAPLGAYDITANVYWLTFAQETDTETDNNGDKTENDPDFWDIGANVTLSNGPSAKNFAWAAGLDFLRQKNDRREKAGNTTTETTYDDAYILIQPRFDFAFPVFAAENAQVFIGLNNRLPIYIYDEIENGNQTTNTYDFGLYSTPNILAEMSLNENWILFGGAAFVWKVIDYKTESVEQGAINDDTSIISMRTNRTNASAGLRFNYDHLVIEASVAEDLDTDAWSGLIGRLGIFLMF